MYNSNTNWHTLGLLIIICGLIGWIALGGRQMPQETPKDNPKVNLPITTTTSVTGQYKQSKSDPDVILDQQYTAKVNGKTVTAPIKDVPGSRPEEGKQGVIKQEVDVTPIYSLGYSNGKKDAKKDWAVGTGLGYTKGDGVVLPVKAERYYNEDNSIEAVVITKPWDKEVTGALIMHNHRF